MAAVLERTGLSGHGRLAARGRGVGGRGAASARSTAGMAAGIERGGLVRLQPPQVAADQLRLRRLLHAATGGALLDALSVTPEYLRNAASASGAVIDYRDWQVPLGRRFRALKLWFVLRHYGARGPAGLHPRARAPGRAVRVLGARGRALRAGRAALAEPGVLPPRARARRGAPRPRTRATASCWRGSTPPGARSSHTPCCRAWRARPRGTCCAWPSAPRARRSSTCAHAGRRSSAWPGSDGGDALARDQLGTQAVQVEAGSRPRLASANHRFPRLSAWR